MLTHNVLQLGDVAVFQDQAITNIDKSFICQRSFGNIPEPAILPNCC